MSKGRRREPTGDELQLWEKVTEGVAPLEARRAKPAAKNIPGDKPKEKPPTPARRLARPLRPPQKPKPPTPPALNPFDRRTLSRVARGAVAIEARVDLHGLTQAAAERRLTRFLLDAQAGGAKLVLVITGKGKPGGSYGGDERGVLRRVVPMWLASAALRPVVIGFDEAGPTHGGAGALYVRVRRARRRGE